MKTPLLRPLLILLCSLVSACNTARGFGEDIQHLGGAIERAVK
ncbi:entericidin A/B family lipoprotein [Cronobacter sakazakii]|nr:entericidin A/B family lipoprotein [Cronobacter sakazakii]KAB1000304.1 entericidin A/B family lipoprotein [Cronobacter sakazakii]KAB1005031.1 entericidin A/B family lipoprotein [Cronobacter sakazakii]KAB1021911.1 entericidin A/B family lipoprotein [Cronobacter sakazakii]MDI9314648.1 entericidin A/B family lipoprotein [Cronobacter sakazakii]NHW71613.1 entericidin A/B family lipoprotein [Cronobacter sakazakii]